MLINKITLPFMGLFFIVSCSNEAIEETSNEEHQIQEKKLETKADSILHDCIVAHGIEHTVNAHFSFTLDETNYSFKNERGNTIYTSEGINELGFNFSDVIENGVFSRTIDNKIVEMDRIEEEQISEAFNSVIYFATLPNKLDDAAVNSFFNGEMEIKGQQYDMIKIVFDQNGGGVDFEDEYCYWINQETKEIDYLGYVYWVNGGGVRLKAAFNKRKVEGVLFQDYEFYEAELGTKLYDLPGLFENNELTLLYKIVLENVRKVK